MHLTLKIWRQKDSISNGKFVTYKLDDVSEDMTFLEMIDFLNEELIIRGDEPVAYDSDCREGICGSCGIMINGRPHGPQRGITTCQLSMTHFKDGDTLIIEPFRARSFPVIKDLIVDRSALDEIMKSGGFVSIDTGSAPEANSILVKKETTCI